MKKCVKPFALLLASIIVLSLFSLAACNKGGEVETGETAETTEAKPTKMTSEDLPPLDPPEPGTKKIAVITGAGIGELLIKKMVEMTGKENPRCVILTTAGKDMIYSVDAAREDFLEFSDDVEVITLCTKLYDPLELRTMLVEADLIFEVGGQSEFMSDTWEKFHVDDYLRLAYERGVVVCGGSAGGMCWTYAAWNDFFGLPKAEYKWFYGIDVVHMYYGPHFHDSSSWNLFHEELMKLKEPKYNIGYAMDSETAIVVVDGEVTEYIQDGDEDFIWKYVFENGEWTCTKIVDYTH